MFRELEFLIKLTTQSVLLTHQGAQNLLYPLKPGMGVVAMPKLDMCPAH